MLMCLELLYVSNSKWNFKFIYFSYAVGAQNQANIQDLFWILF